VSESARGHGGSVAWKMTDQADSAGREARQDLRAQKGELPGKVHRVRGCRRRILARQGDPMDVGWERSLGQRLRSPGLREVRLVLWNSWLRPERRSMQRHVGGPGVRRTLVRPTWICSFRAAVGRHVRRGLHRRSRVHPGEVHGVVPGSNLTQRPVDDAVDRAVDIAVDNFVD
jgi:hypothetical protein